MDSKKSINLKELIDIAIASPELGTVNFNALRTILHIFADKLELTDIRLNVDSTFFQDNTSNYNSIAIDSRNQRCIQNESKESFCTSSDKCEENIEKEISNVEDLSDILEKDIDNSLHFQYINKDFKENVVNKVEKATGSNCVPSSSKNTANIISPKKFSKDQKSITKTHNIKKSQQNRGCLEIVRLKGGSDDNKTAPDLSPTDEEAEAQQIDEETLQKINNILEEAVQNITNLQIDNDDLKYSFQNLVSTIGTLKIVFDDFQVEKLKETVEAIQKEFYDFKCNINYQKCKESQPETLGTYQPETTRTFDHINEQLMFLENESDKTVKQIMFVKKDICKLADRIEEIAENSSKRRSSSGLNLAEIHQEISTLRDFIDKTNTGLDRLILDQQSSTRVIKCLAKNAEDLAKNKLDKDEIDELLAEKADYVVLQRKVSTEYVDNFRKNLENQINEVILKLEENISLLNCKIRSINADLEKQKKDQTLAEFKCKTEKDIAALKQKINQISSIKKDIDAAGTKLKCLRNVNCISCNQDAVMKTMEANAIGKLEKQQPNNSISPMVAYELSDLRQNKNKIKNRDKNDNNLEINRYCGGSHTKININDNDSGLQKGFSSSL